MKTADAVYEYLKREVVPMIAGESELTGAIINGALRASRKKLSEKLSGNTIMQTLGIAGSDGELNSESFRDFAEGMFEERDSVSVSLAELLKMATGIDSDNELLKGKLTLTRADAEKFLALLEK
jgi:hypothetical protein